MADDRIGFSLRDVVQRCADEIFSSSKAKPHEANSQGRSSDVPQKPEAAFRSFMGRLFEALYGGSSGSLRDAVDTLWITHSNETAFDPFGGPCDHFDINIQNQVKGTGIFSEDARRELESFPRIPELDYIVLNVLVTSWLSYQSRRAISFLYPRPSIFTGQTLFDHIRDARDSFYWKFSRFVAIGLFLWLALHLWSLSGFRALLMKFKSDASSSGDLSGLWKICSSFSHNCVALSVAGLWALPTVFLFYLIDSGLDDLLVRFEKEKPKASVVQFRIASVAAKATAALQ